MKFTYKRLAVDPSLSRNDLAHSMRALKTLVTEKNTLVTAVTTACGLLVTPKNRCY